MTLDEPSLVTARTRRERCLVTGFPGALAVRVVDELLKEAHCDISAIVPRDECAEAEHWVQKSMDPARIEIVPGNPLHLDFGLSGARYRALCREVRRAHYLLPSNAFREGVAKGDGPLPLAREALEFCAEAQALALSVFYSSTEVAGDFVGRFHESDLAVGQSFASAGAEQAAAAEAMLRRRMSAFPIAVVRHALLAWDSETGLCASGNDVSLLALVLATAPPEVTRFVSDPRMPRLHLVPVNYVAAAAARIGASGHSAGQTFHLVDPAQPTLAQACAVMREAVTAAEAHGVVSAHIAKSRLKDAGAEGFLGNPRAFLQRYARTTEFSVDHVAARLGAELSCPSFASYAWKLIETLERDLRRSSSPPPIKPRGSQPPPAPAPTESHSP
jgi:thioester reductase-like protein